MGQPGNFCSLHYLNTAKKTQKQTVVKGTGGTGLAVPARLWPVVLCGMQVRPAALGEFRDGSVCTAVPKLPASTACRAADRGTSKIRGRTSGYRDRCAGCRGTPGDPVAGMSCPRFQQRWVNGNPLALRVRPASTGPRSSTRIILWRDALPQELDSYHPLHPAKPGPPLFCVPCA